jgi:hypothetical protein
MVPEDYIVPEFSEAWDNTTVSFRGLIDATIEGNAETTFNQYDEVAKTEMADFMQLKLQSAMANNLVEMFVKDDSETTH